MLTLWYSHNGLDWTQAVKDNGQPVQYVRATSAHAYALNMAKRFGGTVQLRNEEGTVAETITRETTPHVVNSKLKTAVWKDCPGLAEGKYAHSMRDHCWNCAPWWERFPACPHCGRKLHWSGKTKCKGCNTFVMVGEKA